VWQGSLNGQTVAVRQSRRSPASLSWELDLITFLDQHDFVVPTVVFTDEGARSASGVVVQRWINGTEPSSDHDWILIAHELQRLHSLTRGYQQRPGCCTTAQLVKQHQSLDADLGAMPTEVAATLMQVFAEFGDVPAAVIHGDPWEANLRITSTGRVGLLDWDESRVDLTWHDLSPLGVTVLAPEDHRRSQRLSHAWEAANGWAVEPDYAIQRYAQLQQT